MSEVETTPEANEKSFAVKQYYVKSQEFKFKIPPLSIQARDEKFQYQQEMRIQTYKAHGSLYEVTLVLSLAGKLGEQTIFQIELEHAGLFELKGLTEEEITRVLNIQAPHMLYPYASRQVTQMTVDARLEPVHLVPIDFASLYLQEQARQEGGASQENKEEVYTAGADMLTH